MPKSTSEIMMLIANITAIVAIGMMALKMRKYIEDRLTEALSKDEIIQKISLLVKPDMIFDTHGVIVSDRGASAFIQDKGIKFIYEDSQEDGIPSEIHISFLKHIKTAPLLTPIGPDGVFIKSKRGESHTWIYKLDYCMSTEPDDDQDYARNYRLEIL